jgi:hypothetical protein
MGLFNPHVENPKGSRLVSRSLGPDPEHADGRLLVLPQETLLSIARWQSFEQSLAVLLI